MTISSVTKMWSRESSTYRSDDGQTFFAEIREAWQVEHTFDTTPVEIQNAPGLPRYGDVYPGTNLPVREIGASEKIGPIFTIVPIVYRGETGPDGILTGPEEKRPEYRWSNYTSTQPVDEDFNGEPITTVNGEPIEGVTVEISDQQLQIVRNYLTFNPQLTHAYLHATNSDTFATFAPGTARLTGYTADSVVAEGSGLEYWRVSATIRFRYPWRTTAAKAWYARVLHQGMYAKFGGKCKRIPDCNKEPVVKPVPLDASGEPITTGCCPSNTNAHFLEFQLYGSLPYSALGLLG